jgi:meso-butanediol dehydrogenase/(S,S)-butanediol dehydrogenase/diacetyl reductase
MPPRQLRPPLGRQRRPKAQGPRSSSMGGRVAGKVAFVTGAGTGIGRAVAIRLAEEGARVVVTSRTLAHAKETAALVREASGVAPFTLELDQTNQTAISDALQRAVQELGAIDVLSNNAGIDEPTEPAVVDTTDEIWDEAFRVNVTGVFRLCRAAIPLMKSGGSIINMGSGNGIAPRLNAAAYSASKAALLHLTRSLALEVASQHIRVNCVCPGVVDTPMTDLFLAREEDPEAMRAEYAKSNPLGRIADPREIANCVLFLASDESSFMTGAPLIVDGGGLAGG